MKRVAIARTTERERESVCVLGKEEEETLSDRDTVDLLRIGATTFSITTLSINTFSTMDLFLTLGISIKCHYAECRIILLLYGHMVNVVMLNVVAPRG